MRDDLQVQLYADRATVFAPDVCHTTADETIWFSGPYCRAFGPSEKGRVQKVAGVERRSTQKPPAGAVLRQSC